MKVCTKFIMAMTIALGSMSTVTGSDRIEGTRVLAGGRNAPNIIAVAPVKEIRLAKSRAATRTEILAGGRNAPNQVKPAAPTFQIAPAIRKHR